MKKTIPLPIAIIIIVVCAVLVGGIVAWQCWWLPKQEVSIMKFPKIEKKQPLEISVLQLSEMNPKERKNGIEKIEIVDYGFVNTGIYEKRFIYNNKVYVLLQDLSGQGMKAGTTVHYLKKINKDGSKENLRNSLGDIEQWRTGNSDEMAIGYQRNLYLIMSAQTEIKPEDSLVIIKVIGEDDIIKDTLKIKGAEFTHLWGELGGSILIIKDKLYFKLLEDCSPKGFAKIVCYNGYYLFGDNGKFIKSDIFEKEEILIYGG